MKLKTMVLGLAAVGAITFVAGRYSNALMMPVPEKAEMQVVEESITQMAPDFTLPAATGESISLSDFAGKTVVLEWINFGCPYVRKHYDSGNMQKLQEKYTAQDVVWLSINSSAEGKQGHYEGAELLEKISENNNRANFYLTDVTGEVGHLYGAKTTPHMYVINADSQIIYHGAIDSIPSAEVADIATADNYVEAALDAHLKGEEIATSSTQPYGCGVKYN
jgi:cytochrome oxidase Cu insertion factor (SCO1/SenC/PrrC family)